MENTGQVLQETIMKWSNPVGKEAIGIVFTVVWVGDNTPDQPVSSEKLYHSVTELVFTKLLLLKGKGPTFQLVISF